MIDIVTVFHCNKNKTQAYGLAKQILNYEPSVKHFLVDNMEDNRGFSKGCNLGAAQGSSSVIGFVNPDARVKGPFVDDVLEALVPPRTVIAGNRFGKPAKDLRCWGVRGWVSGACMFVKRDWFEKVGGFDERFWMFFEETDLIRQAEASGRQVAELDLPIVHSSPVDDTKSDKALKEFHMTESAKKFYAKWGASSGR